MTYPRPNSQTIPQRIYLTGLRGTGKTTVGKLVAEVINATCIDLDVLIEDTAGRSISEIFAQSGETAFRDLETQCLTSIAQQRESDSDYSRLVALGGGAILRPENRKLIRDSGTCIWLMAAPETLARRMATDDTTAGRRPALTDLSPVDEIEKMLADRKSLYQESSDLQVDTEGKSPQQVTAVILDWLRSAEK